MRRGRSTRTNQYPIDVDGEDATIGRFEPSVVTHPTHQKLGVYEVIEHSAVPNEPEILTRLAEPVRVR
jgi:hypothetical protein